MQTKPNPESETGKTYKRGRPRKLFARENSNYHPTKEELEEDISIPDATPEELAAALFGRHPRRKNH